MKNLFFFAILALVFSLGACTNNSSEKVYEENVNFDTRGTTKTKANVARKWQNGSTWIELNIIGSFEASFDGETTISGRWTLSEDEKTLHLVEEKSAEGKGNSFSQKYTVEELSDAVMRVVDADGKKLELRAQ